ncbi:hypothetical protein [Ruegeria arenilitoris]|uniref:hypothetical protein n=1 Tax=Ruegeria arenilitoris TaxID=1173585 RepID=UPI00147D3F22|nr:hypothetical protein [Ruegeria arenilitoris]
MTTPENEPARPTGPRPSVFLERQSYRRRRLADAARMLPFVGAGLICIPLLWPDPGPENSGVPLSSAILYIFSCWAALIVVSLLFGFAARRMSSSEGSAAESEQWPR